MRGFFQAKAAQADTGNSFADSLYTYRAKIISVYDGDTVTADIDLGLSIWARAEKMWRYGIDTPEIRGGNSESKKRLVPPATFYDLR